MKTTEHVEHLLRQDRKPKELIELGFPKSVVTRVRRQLRKETEASELKTQQGKAQAKSGPVMPSTETTPVQPKQGSLESKVQELQNRVEMLETLRAKLEDIENRLKGTPALGLKNRFQCDCGASGFVALHIQCTKCGRKLGGAGSQSKHLVTTVYMSMYSA